MKILLLTKSTPWCHLVQEVLRKSEHEISIVCDPGLDFPKQNYATGKYGYAPQDRWTGDLIISYLYPRVLTTTELSRAPRAINFHPAPPWHPGFAPYSWAIYKADLEDEGPSSYGYTVHQMDPAVDSGLIYTWDSLPIRYDDTVYRLQQRTMVRLFTEFMKFVERGFCIPVTVNAKWGRTKTKADFEELRQLRSDLPTWDIEARIRACRYPGQPGAYFEGEEA